MDNIIVMGVIEEKRAEKKNEASPKSKGGVGRFFLAALSSFITVTVWLVIGAAYSSVSNMKLDQQALLFPTDLDKPPYSSSSVPEKSRATDLFKADKYTFPYTWKEDGGVKKWFADSIEYSYIPGRKIVRGALEMTKSYIGSDNKSLADGGNYGLATWTGLFITMALSSLSHVYGLISVLIGQFMGGEGAWMYGLLFLFLFGLGPAIAGIVGGVQSIQTFAALAIMPFINNWPTIKKIIKNNIKTFMVVLSIFVLFDALAYLPIGAFIGMFCVFAAGLAMGMF